MMKLLTLSVLLMGCLLAPLATTGCRSTYSVDSISPGAAEREGSLVFVRPDQYTLLGTRSLRDYCEVLYEDYSVNDAGQPIVKIGLRNRGGRHWWDTRGPSIMIAAKAVFYETPLSGSTITSPPVYETNWQRLLMTRGETIHYKFVSPVPAGGYQITFSDAL